MLFHLPWAPEEERQRLFFSVTGSMKQCKAAAIRLAITSKLYHSTRHGAVRNAMRLAADDASTLALLWESAAVDIARSVINPSVIKWLLCEASSECHVPFAGEASPIV